MHCPLTADQYCAHDNGKIASSADGLLPCNDPAPVDLPISCNGNKDVTGVQTGQCGAGSDLGTPEKVKPPNEYPHRGGTVSAR